MAEVGSDLAKQVSAITWIVPNRHSRLTQSVHEFLESQADGSRSGETAHKRSDEVHPIPLCALQDILIHPSTRRRRGRGRSLRVSLNRGRHGEPAVQAYMIVLSEDFQHGRDVPVARGWGRGGRGQEPGVLRTKRVQLAFLLLARP